MTKSLGLTMTPESVALTGAVTSVCWLYSAWLIALKVRACPATPNPSRLHDLPISFICGWSWNPKACAFNSERVDSERVVQWSSKTYVTSFKQINPLALVIPPFERLSCRACCSLCTGHSCLPYASPRMAFVILILTLVTLTRFVILILIPEIIVILELFVILNLSL